MRIQIIKSFSHASTPRPFVTDELVTVPDPLAREWIAAGLAVPFAGNPPEPPEPPAAVKKPAHQKRETAVRG
jgi:hypothetical protein